METNVNRTTQLSVRLSLFLVALVAVFLLIGGAASADTGALSEQPTTVYVVESGDTLWAIAAAQTAEGGDVRVLVSAIKELSGIKSSTLTPGQVLTLPAG